jgi:hypothetical protein
MAVVDPPGLTAPLEPPDRHDRHGGQLTAHNSPFTSYILHNIMICFTDHFIIANMLQYNEHTGRCHKPNCCGIQGMKRVPLGWVTELQVVRVVSPPLPPGYNYTRLPLLCRVNFYLSVTCCQLADI